LPPPAAGRTRACLERYAAQIAGFAPETGLLGATSVLRDAADGAAFLSELAALVGLPARVLSGEEEATLAFAGAVTGTAAWAGERSDDPTGGAAAGGAVGDAAVGDAAAGHGAARVGRVAEPAGAPPPVRVRTPVRPAIVVIDIGGGSMELAVGASPAAAPPAAATPEAVARPSAPPAVARLPAPSFVCSLDVGVVRLTERFFAADPPTEAQWRAARDYVRETLTAAAPASVREPVGRGVGLAGTFTTLVACKLALRTYDRALVHGYELTLADLEAAETLFRDMPSAERGRLPGIQKGREDVILAGVLLAREVCRLFALDGVRVSEADLLDGVALSLSLAS
jgi:exopolyphosphatase/pppGpp-phosphohydrolase